MYYLQGYNAILDLDDCIASMREPLHKILNEESGMDLHWSQWSTVLADSLYGVSGPRFFELALSHRLIERMEPHPEARGFMQRLKDAGIHTTILTARGWHPRGQTVTEGWFRYWEIPFDKVTICQVTDSKVDYIQDMKKLLFTVDDSPKHCNMYARSGVPQHVFAYEMPWTTGKLNENEGIITVNALDEIGNHIEGL